jgi:hypothetical protein
MEIVRIIGKNLFLLNKNLLGLQEAQLWVGPNAEGPKDNNDQRVENEREEAEKRKGEPGWRISGIEAVDLIESEEYPGWFEVNTESWLTDTYRFNIHSKANIQAPNGTPIRPIRDGQYSWPSYSDEDLISLPNDQKQFLYLERNNAGFCIRVKKDKDGNLESAGDGIEWIPKWPEIKKQIKEHYKEKMEE